MTRERDEWKRIAQTEAAARDEVSREMGHLRATYPADATIISVRQMNMILREINRARGIHVGSKGATFRVDPFADPVYQPGVVPSGPYETELPRTVVVPVAIIANGYEQPGYRRRSEAIGFQFGSVVVIPDSIYPLITKA